jgi:hypothetical protein
MAKHAVTTNAAQERALGVMLAAYNARQASGIPPGSQLTADLYFELLAQPLLAEIVEAGNVATSDDIIRAVKTAIDSGNDAKISAVKSALGL